MTLLEGFEQQGYERGLEKGIELGIQQGIELGIKLGLQKSTEKLRQAASKLFHKGYAIEEIIEVTGLSTTEISNPACNNG